MERKEITLTMEEQNKIRVIGLLSEGRLDIGEASRTLGCSERTFYRWKARLLSLGPSGLIHGNRGCKSRRKTPVGTVLKILKLRQDRYSNANDTHFKEMLEKEQGIKIGRSTLRRILRSHGVDPKRKRRAPRHRSRRERKEAFGIMLQLDASHHKWLGDFGPWLALHGAIDDATGHVWAVFEDRETTYGYYLLMREVFMSHGLPLSLYTDRHSIFYPVEQKLDVEAQRRGQIPESQFGRAMRELGIKMIAAYTPQAKGRIERLWATFQDRLVEEMRLAGIRTKEEAKKFLPGYLKHHNKKYAVAPRVRESVFLKSPSKSILDDILCHKEFRVVGLDHTVQYKSRVLQIQKSKGWRTLAKKTVEVWDRPDGIIKIVYQGKILQVFNPQIEEVLYQSAA